MIESALQDYAARIDGALTARMADLTAAEVPERLSRAMAYSLLAGGKRIRGTLVLTAAELAGCPRKLAMPFAMAIEMVHAYSLIHDDLPAMDNDTLRRGKPTSHVVFGEAGAILAGDGLLNLAFEDMLAACTAQGAPAVAAAGCIAMAAGSAGMVGGQVLDIDATGHFAGEEALREMHAKKTGALLRAAIGAGLRLGSAPQGLVAAMERYGGHLGLLFQITELGGKVIFGTVIIVVGLFLARILSNLVGTSTGEHSYAQTVVYYSIAALFTAIGLTFMGLADQIVMLAFGLILWSAAIAAAIAFGLGGRDFAARMLEEWSRGNPPPAPRTPPRIRKASPADDGQPPLV